SLLPLPLDGGFLIVLSPFHLLEESSLHHELLQRLERWLDLIVAHFDFHGSNSLLDASAFGGAKVTWPRRVGSREVQVPDEIIVRRIRLTETTVTVMIDASRRALPGPYSETDGSLRPTIYRKREAELLFALVGGARSLLLPVAVASHPTRVLEGIEQVSPLGKPAPRRSARTEPSPAGSSRHAVGARKPEQTLRKLCSHLKNRGVWVGPPWVLT